MLTRHGSFREDSKPDCVIVNRDELETLERLEASHADLLAACKAAYRILVYHRSCRDETKQLRAAIAKATQEPADAG